MLIENAPPQPFNGYKLKHPRLRGEDGFESCQPRHTKETPPLTRGRRGAVLGRVGCAGNTPAYAGKTTKTHRRGKRIWKHPRLRGEDVAICFLTSSVGETPPLTRGRQQPKWTTPSGFGNTPAYAGKTFPHDVRPQPPQKHPRLRGEDYRYFPNQITGKETPPLTRGRPSARPLARLYPRNTPAYAGKTRSGSIYRILTRKHPRLRGEDKGRVAHGTGRAETPPLTRGRPDTRRPNASS